MRRRVAVVLGVAVAVVGAGVMSPAHGAPGKERVKVTNFKYAPKTVKIRKGGKVVWAFKQGRHDVRGKGWGSPLKRSGTWSKRFRKRGTFKYFCSIHPGMAGKVRVVRR
jgi:plastocyanin